jgi:mono/diheme cytochrome c family protein
MQPVKPIAALLTTALLAVAAAQPRTTAPDFHREVRPILSQHCFKCHGPDDKTRTAGLRLDTPSGAFAKLPSGKRAVVPGRPDQSELVKRVALTSAPLMMPPAHANKPLSDAQRDILRRWVASGAQYRPHWAFVAPKPSPLPAVQNTAWPRSPIDRFILARLEKSGLQPAPEADRYTLIRRVSLDLIGLPPTPAEVDAFLRDTKPNAYERLVDRLLASPHYGERWARRWMDLARYADTNGYEKDRPRSIWPWRDWVINALNADMPYTQFTIEQIAGDMLPNPTPQQITATGFHRNTMLNEEGGIDPLEFRYHSMTDRMAVTGTVWLGLTTACAQCHTHKYDPITQRDYYRMMACINNANEIEVDVPDPTIRRRREEIQAKIDNLEQNLPQQFPPAPGRTPLQSFDDAFRTWKDEQASKIIRWEILKPTKAESSLPLLTPQPDNSILSTGDVSKRDVYDITFRTDLAGVTAIRLEALTHPSLPKNGPGRTWYEGPFGDFFLSELLTNVDGKPIKIASADQTFAAGVYNAGKAIDGDPQTGWSVSGQVGVPHNAVFRLEQPIPAGNSLHIRMIFEKYYAAALGRFRISISKDPRAAKAYPSAEIEDLLATPLPQRPADAETRLRRWFASTTPQLAAARAEIDKLRSAMPAYPTTLVMQERPANYVRPTHLHNRGEYLQPKEPVTPSVPAFLLGGAPPPKNRLEFARWLVSPQNPLTARVAVNRTWQALFGRGIVATTEDFGFQGQAPSHPELLDWLAVHFMQNGWSMKRLHKLIVTSAAYRQSSAADNRKRTKDPLNILLSRGPRVRMEAEMVRDHALTASGLLSRKIGGPSVFPPQPAGVTSEGTYGPLQWKVSEGEDRYRRGIYTFAKRTAPYAMFLTFDGPSGEACLARREVSNTPLQALTLLNDQVFTEAAQKLGAQAAAHPDDATRCTQLFRTILTRLPTPREHTLLLSFLQKQKARFAENRTQAQALAGAEGTAPLEDRAACTALARALLNTDEALVK